MTEVTLDFLKGSNVNISAVLISLWYLSVEMCCYPLESVRRVNKLCRVREMLSCVNRIRTETTYQALRR